LIYLAFQTFDYEPNWWSLFQKRVVRISIDIYIFLFLEINFKSSLENECSRFTPSILTIA
jgi:hypothetical protein